MKRVLIAIAHALCSMSIGDAILEGCRAALAAYRWGRLKIVVRQREGQSIMRDRLPSIHINVADQRHFLERMAAISERLDSLALIRQDGAESNHHTTVSIRLVGSSPHQNSSAHLTVGSNADSKVHVNVSINSDDFPSYEIYCAAATAIINPLLKVYNREEHTRCRMTIESKRKLEPRLSPQRAKAFKHFTEAANKSDLSASDWRRFYEFVRLCRLDFHSHDLEYLLVKEGFCEAYARHVAEVYEHLQDFRRPRTAAEAYEYYHVVKGLRWTTS